MTCAQTFTTKHKVACCEPQGTSHGKNAAIPPSALQWVPPDCALSVRYHKTGSVDTLLNCLGNEVMHATRSNLVHSGSQVIVGSSPKTTPTPCDGCSWRMPLINSCVPSQLNPMVSHSAKLRSQYTQSINLGHTLLRLQYDDTTRQLLFCTGSLGFHTQKPHALFLSASLLNLPLATTRNWTSMTNTNLVSQATKLNPKKYARIHLRGRKEPRQPSIKPQNCLKTRC